MESQRERQTALGEVASWGSVGYVGRAFAPSDQTYPGVSAGRINYTHRADSGDHPAAFCGGQLANLVPLVLSSMWESAFALEAGPLTTWGN